MDEKVEVLGTDTCKDTNATRSHLENLGVSYRYVNIEKDQDAARRVEAWHGGERKTPTVILKGRALGCDDPGVLSVPSDTELDVELDRRHLMPRDSAGDGSPGLS